MLPFQTTVPDYYYVWVDGTFKTILGVGNGNRKRTHQKCTAEVYD